MGFDRSQTNFKKLVKILREGKQRVIPFVGAGLSIYGAPEQRLPQWNELIAILKRKALDLGLISEEKASLVKKLVKDKKPIAAADIVVNALGENQFRLAMEDLFDIRNRPLPPAILELACVGWSLVVTTNLDRFIETAWSRKHRSPLQVITSEDPTNLTQAVLGHNLQPTLLKTHGTIERYNTWVLTEAHYKYLLTNNPAYIHALKILYSQTLFFVGYGLSDKDFEPLLAQLRELYPAGLGNNFVLYNESAKGTEWMNHMIRDYGLQPIWYRVDPTRINEVDCGHGEVLECLQLLVEAWITGQRKIPITLKAFPEPEILFVGRRKELEDISHLILDESCQAIQIIGFGGEGKTSLVQQWLKKNHERLAISHFKHIFGCSFYKADVGRFIEYAYSLFCPNGRALDINSKVKALARILHNESYLLILDGLESVQRENGELTNPYLREIIEATYRGQSTVLITSRIPLESVFKTIDLTHLSEEEAISILKEWGISDDTEMLRYAIKSHIGTHALSVRIMAGFMKAEGLNNFSCLENLHPAKDVYDEADPLKINKATRILRFYQEFLSAEELAFMKTFAVFRRAVPKTTILEIFQEDFGDDATNSPLRKIDLNLLIDKLKKRGLLLQEHETELTCHPLVRDYFFTQLSLEETYPIHQKLAGYLLDIAESRQPKTLEGAQPLFEACYHASRAKKWKMYHYIFSQLINRGLSFYLGYVLGAWEEFLSLAALAYPNEDLTQKPEYLPEFYYGAVALSLKRLGQSREAVPFYFESIKGYIKSDPKETARQINNLFILYCSMGNFQLASCLAELNIVAINWIAMDWQKFWQLDCVYTTFGKLCSRLGELSKAKLFFEKAECIRREKDYKRMRFYDLQRIAYVDLLLALGDSFYEKAREVAKKNLEAGREGGWRDTISSALRAFSSICRAEAENIERKSKLLTQAQEYLDESLQIASELFQPELEIEVLLEGIRLAIAKYEAKLDHQENVLSRAYQSGEKVLRLIENTSLHLYEPEALTLLGKIQLLRSNIEDAGRLAKKAKALACKNGDKLVLANDWLDLSPLLWDLNIQNDFESKCKEIEFPDFDQINSMKMSTEEFLAKIEEIQKEWCKERGYGSLNSPKT
ncbi:MAG: SIR2 family protein [Theionarchaea archaeon]|nr:MAG: hypothetical protein AYK19_20600 [Theionarchaea archaeon DG-70-1]MBU7028238.1 SIR2 family protein [Theionarchaea archaeon]